MNTGNRVLAPGGPSVPTSSASAEDEDLAAFFEHVVPILQARGLFRADHAADTPAVISPSVSQ
jgi:hypothetical protein